MANSKLEVKES